MFYSYKLDDKIFANVFYVEKSLRSNTDGDKKDCQHSLDVSL